MTERIESAEDFMDRWTRGDGEDAWAGAAGRALIKRDAAVRADERARLRTAFEERSRIGVVTGNWENALEIFDAVSDLREDATLRRDAIDGRSQSRHSADDSPC